MKKQSVKILSLALCIMICSLFALASCSKTFSIKNIYDKTNFDQQLKQMSNAEFVSLPDGASFTDTTYAEKHGVCIVVKENKLGIYDLMQKKCVSDFTYDNIVALNETYGLYLASSTNEALQTNFKVINSTGKVVADLGAKYVNIEPIDILVANSDIIIYNKTLYVEGNETALSGNASSILGSSQADTTTVTLANNYLCVYANNLPKGVLSLAGELVFDAKQNANSNSIITSVCPLGNDLILISELIKLENSAKKYDFYIKPEDTGETEEETSKAQPIVQTKAEIKNYIINSKTKKIQALKQTDMLFALPQRPIFNSNADEVKKTYKNSTFVPTYKINQKSKSISLGIYDTSSVYSLFSEKGKLLGETDWLPLKKLNKNNTLAKKANASICIINSSNKIVAPLGMPNNYWVLEDKVIAKYLNHISVFDFNGKIISRTEFSGNTIGNLYGDYCCGEGGIKNITQNGGFAEISDALTDITYSKNGFFVATDSLNMEAGIYNYAGTKLASLNGIDYNAESAFSINNYSIMLKNAEYCMIYTL